MGYSLGMGSELVVAKRGQKMGSSEGNCFHYFFFSYLVFLKNNEVLFARPMEMRGTFSTRHHKRMAQRPEKMYNKMKKKKIKIP